MLKKEFTVAYFEGYGCFFFLFSMFCCVSYLLIGSYLSTEKLFCSLDWLQVIITDQHIILLH